MKADSLMVGKKNQFDKDVRKKTKKTSTGSQNWKT